MNRLTEQMMQGGSIGGNQRSGPHILTEIMERVTVVSKMAAELDNALHEYKQQVQGEPPQPPGGGSQEEAGRVEYVGGAYGEILGALQHIHASLDRALGSINILKN